MARPNQKKEEGNQSLARPSQKKEEVNTSVAKPSQSCRRKNTASLNTKPGSKHVGSHQKKTLTKQILTNTPRKNVSRGKICSPFKTKNEKMKRVADIRVYFEAKMSRSPSFKGGGGNNKQAENQIQKTKLTHSNLDPANLHGEVTKP